MESTNLYNFTMQNFLNNVEVVQTLQKQSTTQLVLIIIIKKRIFSCNEL